MIDFERGTTVPTRRALEEIVEWAEPAREQLGLELSLPEHNGAQRARAALAEGASIEEVYREAVAETRSTYAPAAARVGDD